MKHIKATTTESAVELIKFVGEFLKHTSKITVIFRCITCSIMTVVVMSSLTDFRYVKGDMYMTILQALTVGVHVSNILTFSDFFF